MRAIALIALLATPAAAQEEIGWPEALESLVQQKTRAVTCASVLKRWGGAGSAPLYRGELSYTEGKAETDALIAGLRLRLARCGGPDDGGLAEKLRAAERKRLEVCEDARSVAPDDAGSRGIFGDLLKEIVGPVTEALLARFDANCGRTVEAVSDELERARWPEFREVQP